MLGGWGDKVSVMSSVYPRGTVSVSSFGSFSSMGSSSKPSHPSLPISIGVIRIQEYFKKKRGGAKIHQATGGEGQARAADEENRGDSQSNVGCWLLVVGPHGINI